MFGNVSLALTDNYHGINLSPRFRKNKLTPSLVLLGLAEFSLEEMNS